MDLSAVAKQKARGGRAEPASPSATASMEYGDDDESGSDDGHDLGIDSESAKQVLRAFVKNSLDGVRSGQRAQYYEVLEHLDGLSTATPGDENTYLHKRLMLEVLGCLLYTSPSPRDPE